MTTKTLLTRLEDDQALYESGVQLRSDNPVLTGRKRIWYNIIEEKMKFYDDTTTYEKDTRSESDSPIGNIVFPPTNTIDWNAGTQFLKSGLSGTINLAFSNVSTKTIYIALDSLGLLSSVVNLPAGTKTNFGSLSISLQPNEGTFLRCQRVNGVIYADRIFYGELTPFPAGTDGDLIITSGQTVSLSAGSIRDYNSINIASGGTLNLSGGGNITQIYCANDCVINGQIIGRRVSNGFSNSVTTVTGEGLSYSVAQAGGGGGGPGRIGGDPPNPGGSQDGGPGANGYGGGGSGGGYSPHWEHFAGAGGSGGGASGRPPGCPTARVGQGNVTNANGGNGGNAAAPGGPTGPGRGQGGAGGGSGGGAGAGVTGYYIAPGFSLKGPASPVTVSGTGGGGGGGGMKGNHGKALYLYVAGNFIGSGSINMGGTNGFSGGNGGIWTAPFANATGFPGTTTSCGAGGGGGAGGSGGRIWIRESVAGNFNASSISTNVSRGTGGGGGTRGFRSGTGPYPNPAQAASGGGGGNGNNGTLEITIIP